MGSGASKEKRVLLLGCRGAGKQTILRVNYGPPCMSPELGITILEANTEEVTVFSWDMGGHTHPASCEKFLKKKNAKGLVWVVDSSDRNTLLESRFQLQWALSHPEMDGAPLLVLANKQDVGGDGAEAGEAALAPEEVADRLGVAAYEGQRAVRVVGSCAESNEGVREGMGWLLEAMDEAVVGADPPRPPAPGSSLQEAVEKGWPGDTSITK
eukprot:TRINITY_DN1354_c0_g2_i3.p1 TRINITY_DN1354_c0_g2~~TRINITY_DN1354_c0_g2_i3.p1  ORF type:complete len:248 (-),score=62.12 TRINITY_DN1354_c0_g2_i3:105-740(-)